ncbi:MAG TPA: hypothetical protein VMH35_21110 [Streptosporangiaceae bacterium]|nr:hypothetical protein [Streptosporangiaceae bacterium]
MSPPELSVPHKDGTALGSPPRRTRALSVLSAACIGLAIAIMIFVCAAGRSRAEVGVAHPPAGPPWWVPLHLSVTFVALALWFAALIGAAGVAAGLVAVARGARPSFRLLGGAAFVAIAALTVLPAAGSTDPYDYAAYGRIVLLGHNPYQMTPYQLRRTGDPVGRAAPHAWIGAVSDYGPAASIEQAAAAGLGGRSAASIIFWLKLASAVAFGGVALLLDRLLRGDPARRARAHLWWTLNPLLLWGLVAGGHVDGLGAAIGFCGLILLRAARPGDRPSLARVAAAAALVGVAADVKITFALYGLGIAWALRRSLAGLATAAAAALAVLLLPYLWFGRPALSVLTTHRDATNDTLYRLFSRALLHPTPAEIGLVIVPVVIITTGAVLSRLPDGFPARPAIHPAFAVSLAWMLAWPYQRPWYDAMVLALFALYPMTRLDWPLLFQLTLTSIFYLPGVPGRFPHWTSGLHTAEVTAIMPAARLVTLLAVLALCITGAWQARRPGGHALAGLAA